MSSIHPVRPSRALVRLGLCAALVFGAVACSDDDGDSRTIESEDGEVTVSGDGEGGEGVITGPDGEETRFSAGDSASLPDGWPEELPLPDDTELTAGTSTDGGSTLTVMAVSEGDVPELYEHFRTLLTDQGYDLVVDTLSDLGEETMASIQAEGDDHLVAVVLMADVEEEGRTSMSLVVDANE